MCRDMRNAKQQTGAITWQKPVLNAKCGCGKDKQYWGEENYVIYNGK